MVTDITIKDFVYLDFERIRSFAAQLLRGVPETSVRDSSSAKKGGLGLSVGIQGLASINTEGGMLLEKGTHETRSTHHHLYNLFEDGLKSLGKLKTVDRREFPAGWKPGDFSECEFVLINGPVQFYDFKECIDKIGILPALMDAVSKFRMQTLVKMKSAGELSDTAFKKEKTDLKESSIPKGDIEKLKTVIESFYKDAVRFKAYIDDGLPDYSFIGLLQRSVLQPDVSIRERFGIRSSADWSVLGVINFTRKLPFITRNLEEATLEEKLEGFIAALEEFNKVALTVPFPAISITPLAIYRVL